MGHSSEVIYLSMDPEVPTHDYWDQTLLDALLLDLPAHDRQIVIIPGARQGHLVDDISMELEQYSKVLVVITSDEEALFPTEKLYHPDMVLYVMYPRPKHKMVDRYLPIGYPPKARDLMTFQDKTLDWFFSGQVTHDERRALVEKLRERTDGYLIETQGFAQGLSYKEYIDLICKSKALPCPSGYASPDSFRLYETLESGGIPIVAQPDFWKLLFGEVPFRALDNWNILGDLLDNYKNRPDLANTCFAWWQRMKRQLRYDLEKDLGIKREGVTVLIPTSPIESHPSTEIIEQTINSIRERLPDSEIILMIDGVRSEQANRKDNYTEYTRRLLWKANHEWKDIYPLLFEEHAHQANMTREALKHVLTPYILFVEHDTPLCGEIPFELMYGCAVNLIRFHYEAQVHPEHKHLMLDEQPQIINGVPLLGCAQWSQRPHLAKTDFYRNIIDTYFPSSGSTMIEDKIYGILETAWFDRGKPGWKDFDVWMYAPEEDIKRSLNLDGRGDESKYSMRFE